MLVSVLYIFSIIRGKQQRKLDSIIDWNSCRSRAGGRKWNLAGLKLIILRYMHQALDFTVQCVYIRDSETVLSYICLQTGNASTIIYIQLYFGQF